MHAVCVVAFDRRQETLPGQGRAPGLSGGDSEVGSVVERLHLQRFKQMSI